MVKNVFAKGGVYQYGRCSYLKGRLLNSITSWCPTQIGKKINT